MTGRMVSLYLALKHHAVALAILSIAAIAGQVATLNQPSLVSFGNDSPTYTLVAQRMVMTPTHFIDASRTPGYPAFLALVFALTGGVNYAKAFTCYADNVAMCQHIFTPIVVAQVVLMLCTLFECYVLVYRITRRRWMAALLVSFISINLYFLSWERMILTETLSVWSIVTLFLCFDSFLRRPTWMASIALTALSVFCVMVRPSAIILPPLLLGALFARQIWTKSVSREWTKVAVSAALIGVCLFGYAEWNGAVNGVFGLSYISDVNLFGKVLEYHMQDLPVDPKYQTLQREANAYVSRGAYDPYGFAQQYGMYYPQTHATDVGKFARSIILRHPVSFARHTISDLRADWLTPGFLYPDYGVDLHKMSQAPADPSVIPGITGFFTRYGVTPAYLEPRWMEVLLIVSTAEQRSYVLLPLVALLLFAWLWGHPKDVDRFLLLTIAIAVIAAIGLAAAGDYTEAERVRFPMDWGMFLIEGVVILQALAYALRRISGSAGLAPQPANTPSPAVRGSSAIETGASARDTSTSLSDDGLAVTLPRVRAYPTTTPDDPRSS